MKESWSEFGARRLAEGDRYVNGEHDGEAEKKGGGRSR
jgi:hypothetical protein